MRIPLSSPKRRLRTIAIGALSTLLCCLPPMAILPPFAGTSASWARAGRFRLPPPPPDRDAPGNRGGGAGRNCGMANQTSTALVPQYQQSLPQGNTMTQVWGTTVLPAPTFWFDVPHAKGAIVAMEFILQDPTQPTQELYRATLRPPDQPGIIRVRLPQTVPALVAGASYQWFFKVRLQCGSTQAGVKPQISTEQLTGWVQRIQPDARFAAQLQQATPQQQISLYAENGVWFDLITTLAELSLKNPKDSTLTQDWRDLLTLAGLDRQTQKPLTNCCQPIP